MSEWLLPYIVGVVDAFDEAWKLDRGNCALYYK